MNVLFKEYSGADKRVQAEYFESYQTFTLQLQKKLTSQKLINTMTSKDWRVFDSLLSHVKQITLLVENSGIYFSKSGLLNGLLK